MHLKKLVPIVGFCAVSLFSNGAMAQLWAKNCATNQCLDATTAEVNGMVQVSDCDTSKIAQQWHQNSPWKDRLENAYEGFGNPCLDMNAETSVVTNKCNKVLKAQKWTFADNGQVGPIQNYYWNTGNQCIVVGSDGNKVTAANCNGEESQDWYWVNVGDTTKCPIIEPRMKLPTTLEEDSRMKLPITQEDQRMKLPTTLEEDSRMKLPTTLEEQRMKLPNRALMAEDSRMKLPTTLEEQRMKLPTTLEEDSRMKLPQNSEKE